MQPIPARARDTDAAQSKASRIPVWLWLAALAIALGVALRANYVADLSAFLPSAPTPEQAVLLDQLKNGAASRLVLIGIEGGSADTRADASRKLAATLRADTRFASVNNGDTAAYGDAGRFVFDHRYVLSPAVDAARFEAAGLRTAIDDTVALIASPAGARLKPLLFRDPTGETARIAEALTPSHGPRTEGGVWVSRDAPRAVLMATTIADGGDLDGQQAALAAVQAALVEAAPSLRLSISGAGAFGVDSRSRIKAEVERLAIFGSAIVVALLLAAFASLRSLGIALLPVATGVLAGIAATQLAFGQVHGMTLGFGTTLIGEAVDYAIYYLVQTRAIRDAGSNEAPSKRWRRASWPTVRLGLFTSLIGFAALVFAGFPGLAQLGVFSIAGLAAAAATTRFVFPVLAPAGSPGRGLRAALGRAMQWASKALPRLRFVVLGLGAAAVLALAWLPSPWRGELTSLSPVSAQTLALDATLRADLGAPDAGTLVAVSAAGEAAALAGAEAVGVRLDALVAAGVIDGYDSPARFLPSAATQAARLASLPDAATLTARLASATEGGPIAASRLAPFIADVQTARAQPPITRASLDGSPLGAAVDALLLAGDGAGRPWRALISLQSGSAKPIDAARVRLAIADVPAARLVSVRRELDDIYARFLRTAAWQAGLGALAIMLLLAWQLRSARRLGAVLLPIAVATLVVLGALAASGAALGILHLVGLLLTVAIGSNYALFFEHMRFGRLKSGGAGTAHDGNGNGNGSDSDSDSDMLASLLLANLTTVASFGLLAASSIPVLHAIGIVVAPGALLSLAFSAALLPRLGAPERHGKIGAP